MEVGIPAFWAVTQPTTSVGGQVGVFCVSPAISGHIHHMQSRFLPACISFLPATRRNTLTGFYPLCCSFSAIRCHQAARLPTCHLPLPPFCFTCHTCSTVLPRSAGGTSQDACLGDFWELPATAVAVSACLLRFCLLDRWAPCHHRLLPGYRWVTAGCTCAACLECLRFRATTCHLPGWSPPPLFHRYTPVFYCYLPLLFR